LESVQSLKLTFRPTLCAKERGRLMRPWREKSLSERSCARMEFIFLQTFYLPCCLKNGKSTVGKKSYDQRKELGIYCSRKYSLGWIRDLLFNRMVWYILQNDL
jgi:hypothetical protein